MISPELNLQLLEVAKNLMHERMNREHDADTHIKIYEAHHAILMLADPTYTGVF